jgi:phospholipid/cholesterol/gamma-HCH transport system substrate-binding protein
MAPWDQLSRGGPPDRGGWIRGNTRLSSASHFGGPVGCTSKSWKTQRFATLNRVVQDIDRGRGTIGGLVRDPTVYEDLKTTLGNVQRNVLFKALIRFTMENDGLRRAERAPRALPVAPTPARAGAHR